MLENTTKISSDLEANDFSAANSSYRNFVSDDRWSYPKEVNIGCRSYKIRAECDYRIVLDCISALNDPDLSDDLKVGASMFIFYDEEIDANHADGASKAMFDIISGIWGVERDIARSGGTAHRRIMDWEYDFGLIAPPVSRVLGYDIRDPEKYTHWFSFLSAYSEIGECTFSTVVSIRSKKIRGKPLDKFDLEFYRQNRDIVDLPVRLSIEEKEFFGIK